MVLRIAKERCQVDRSEVLLLVLMVGSIVSFVRINLLDEVEQ